MIVRFLFLPELDRMPRAPTFAAALALLGILLVVCGCSSPMTVAAVAPAYKPIELNIAHINDHHSQLEPFGAVELTLDGIPTQVELGGFARQAALFASLSATPNLLKLHAGDAVTGSLYYTLFKGAADAQLMGAICFDAFVPGNHEFDDGDSALKGLLDELAKGACKTPALSANIAPQTGTALVPTAAAAYLQPYVIKQVDGVPVGIVGITISGKTSNSSRPLATTRFLDEVNSAQQAIDALKQRGVRHIVLLTHQGYANDKAMAAQLTDVDVIIGGDSHSLLGDFAALGLGSSGAYPTLARNKSGETVCIGQAWEYAKALGLMNVKFDGNGSVSACGGQAALVIGDSFRRKDGAGVWQDVGAIERQALIASLAASSAIKVVQPDAAAAAALAAYGSKVAAEKSRTIGVAAQPLCLVRVPGESTNRSGGTAGCEAANALARGSDVAQVVAEAFLSASKRADFALQNAGGVRNAVPAGRLAMNTAFTLLPFSNVLVELEVQGSEMIAALEDAVSNHLDHAQSDGSYPYAAGLRWHLDMRRPRGQRFSNVQVRSKSGKTWTPIDAAGTYVLVTNDFVAAGKDGYATLGRIFKKGGYVNTYLLYTQSFVDHVIAKGTLARPPAADYSHQSVIGVSGVPLP